MIVLSIKVTSLSSTLHLINIVKNFLFYLDDQIQIILHGNLNGCN